MLELRPYQQECSDRVMDSLLRVRKVGVIAATGSGKTEMFIDISRRYLVANQGLSVLVLSHLDLLTKQTHQRFKMRLPNLKAGILQGKLFPDCFDDVVISTMQSSSIEEKASLFKNRLIKPVGLIIVDEAHYILTPSYRKIIEEFFPEAKVLGVTASPFRDGHIMTNYFDEIAFSISSQELIDQGYLVAPELHQMIFEERSVEERMATVAKIYLEKEKGKKAIVFMSSKDEARSMRNVMVAHGIKSSAVTDDTRGDVREKIFYDYKHANTDILTSVSVLTAGFDCDKVEAIFMPFATKSPTVYMQRVGRGLRPSEGKKSCRVYLFGDSPSIKRGLYQSLQDYALTDGSERPKRKQTVMDELQWMEISGDYSAEKYEWTKMICDVVSRVESLGNTELSDLLAEKKFPKRFLKDIGVFSQSLSANPSTKGEAIGPEQVRYLVAQGFKSQDLSGLSEGSAMNLITSIQNYLNRDPFVIKEGRLRGKHISDVHPYAVKMARDKNLTRLYYDWKRSKDKGNG